VGDLQRFNDKDLVQGVVGLHDATLELAGMTSRPLLIQALFMALLHRHILIRATTKALSCLTADHHTPATL
jgi:hypothetical protein